MRLGGKMETQGQGKDTTDIFGQPRAENIRKPFLRSHQLARPRRHVRRGIGSNRSLWTRGVIENFYYQFYLFCLQSLLIRLVLTRPRAYCPKPSFLLLSSLLLTLLPYCPAAATRIPTTTHVDTRPACQRSADKSLAGSPRPLTARLSAHRVAVPPRPLLLLQPLSPLSTSVVVAPARLPSLLAVWTMLLATPPPTTTTPTTASTPATPPLVLAAPVPPPLLPLPPPPPPRPIAQGPRRPSPAPRAPSPSTRSSRPTAPSPTRSKRPSKRQGLPPPRRDAPSSPPP